MIGVPCTPPSFDKVIHVMTLQGIQVWHVWQQNGSAFVVGKILLKFSIFVHMLIYFPYTQLYISHHFI